MSETGQPAYSINACGDLDTNNIKREMDKQIYTIREGKNIYLELVENDVMTFADEFLLMLFPYFYFCCPKSLFLVHIHTYTFFSHHRPMMQKYF